MCFFTPRKRQRVVENLLTNLGSLLVNMYEVISYGTNPLVKNSFGIYVEFVLAVGVALENFEVLSVITMTW